MELLIVIFDITPFFIVYIEITIQHMPPSNYLVNCARTKYSHHCPSFKFHSTFCENNELFQSYFFISIYIKPWALQCLSNQIKGSLCCYTSLYTVIYSKCQNSPSFLPMLVNLSHTPVFEVTFSLFILAGSVEMKSLLCVTFFNFTFFLLETGVVHILIVIPK